MKRARLLHIRSNTSTVHAHVSNVCQQSAKPVMTQEARTLIRWTGYLAEITDVRRH